MAGAKLAGRVEQDPGLYRAKPAGTGPTRTPQQHASPHSRHRCPVLGLGPGPGACLPAVSTRAGHSSGAGGPGQASCVGAHPSLGGSTGGGAPVGQALMGLLSTEAAAVLGRDPQKSLGLPMAAAAGMRASMTRVRPQPRGVWWGLGLCPPSPAWPTGRSLSPDTLRRCADDGAFDAVTLDEKGRMLFFKGAEGGWPQGSRRAGTRVGWGPAQPRSEPRCPQGTRSGRGRTAGLSPSTPRGRSWGRGPWTLPSASTTRAVLRTTASTSSRCCGDRRELWGDGGLWAGVVPRAKGWPPRPG